MASNTERLLEPETATTYEAFLTALDTVARAEGQMWPYAQQGLFQYIAVPGNTELASVRFRSRPGTLIQSAGNGWRRWQAWRDARIVNQATTADLQRAEIVWILRPSSFAIYETVAHTARQLSYPNLLLIDSSLPEKRSLEDMGQWGTAALYLADKFRELTPAIWREAGRRSELLLHVLGELLPALPPALPGLVWRNCLEAILTERFVQRHLLPYVQPRLVVSALDVETEAATVHLLTQAAGISGVVVQHGTAMDLLFPSIASRGLLWGEQSLLMARSYESNGRTADYYLSGAPRTDQNYQLRQRMRENNRPSQILFVSQFSQHQAFPEQVNREVATLLLDLAERLDGLNAQLTFRPRSAACLNAFGQFSGHNSQAMGTIRLLAADESLSAQLAQADMVIGIDSAALLEAMQAGIPVIQLWGAEGQPRLNFYQDGSLLLARCAAEVEAYFCCLLREPAWKHERLAAQDRRLQPLFAHPGHATEQTLHWFQQQLSLQSP